MQKITPFLWYNDQAEEAARFYCSLFKNSKIGEISRYGEAGPGPAGSVMTISFQIEGQEFIAFNGGPHFTFTPAISLFVNCDTQAEVDDLWAKFTEGGREDMCGWLTDKFGLSWQIIPSGLLELNNSSDAEASRRAMDAMLKMSKIDIEKVRQAYAGK